MYGEKRIEDIKTLIKRDLDFKEIVFQKEVAGDLYYIAYDSIGNENRIRIKPQAGTVFTWVQGNWRQVKGYKFE